MLAGLLHDTLGGGEKNPEGNSASPKYFSTAGNLLIINRCPVFGKYRGLV